MQQININELIPHPRNNEFFDDITGNRWDDLLDSIKRRGIIQSIIITKNKTIVSGHQRVRACKELGIQQIKYEMNEYSTEDEILEDLISTNLKQRVIGNDNPVKLGRCFKELERIYGIEYGGDRKSSGTKFNLKTQEDLAKEYGISTKMLSNYKKLTTLIPEIQDLVENETVSPTVASRIITKLSTEEQEELISNLDTTKKYTQKQIQEYINRNQQLQNQINQLKNQPPKVVEKEKVIDKTDYSLSSKNRQLQSDIDKITREKQRLEEINKGLSKSKQLTDDLNAKYKVQVDEYMNVKSKILDLNLDPNGEYNLYSVMKEVEGLTTDIENLLVNKLAPLRYRTTLQVIKNSDLKKNFANIISMVNEWCDDMSKYIGIEIKNNKFDNFIELESEEI